MSPIARQHPDKDLQLWFEDEARVGPKGRATHVWFEKGVRPTAPADKRFASVSLFGAVRAGTDEAFALVRPFATAAVTSVFLQEFSKSLAPNAHAVLVLDRRGGTEPGGCVCPRTSALCFCRLTRRSSIPWSACGFICASSP